MFEAVIFTLLAVLIRNKGLKLYNHICRHSGRLDKVKAFKEYSIKPLFKDWSFYPFLVVFCAYLIFQANIFMGNYSIVNDFGIFKYLYVLVLAVMAYRRNCRCILYTGLPPLLGRWAEKLTDTMLLFNIMEQHIPNVLNTLKYIKLPKSQNVSSKLVIENIPFKTLFIDIFKGNDELFNATIIKPVKDSLRYGQTWEAFEATVMEIEKTTGRSLENIIWLASVASETALDEAYILGYRHRLINIAKVQVDNVQAINELGITKDEN